MARPKEFDVDAALQQALQVFWQKGYEATSMQDLVDAMGIQKASLYATYGDKHSLYMQALRNYQRDALVEMETTLTRPGSPKAALRALLQGVVEQAAGKRGRRGCFCVNANIELAPSDPVVGEQLRDHTGRVEAMLQRTLAAARAAGEIPRSADTAQLASFLYGLLLAINVLARQRAPKPRLQAIADQGLAALGA